MRERNTKQCKLNAFFITTPQLFKRASCPLISGVSLALFYRPPNSIVPYWSFPKGLLQELASFCWKSDSMLPTVDAEQASTLREENIDRRADCVHFISSKDKNIRFTDSLSNDVTSFIFYPKDFLFKLVKPSLFS